MGYCLVVLAFEDIICFDIIFAGNLQRLTLTFKGTYGEVVYKSSEEVQAFLGTNDVVLIGELLTVPVKMIDLLVLIQKSIEYKLTKKPDFEGRTIQIKERKELLRGIDMH